MSITLDINHSELDQEGLDQLTQELCLLIDDETDIEPELVSIEGKQGTKAADVITIGSVLLTFLSSGSAVALFGIIKAYFERQPALELTFKNEQGLDVKVNAKNVDSADIQKLIIQLSK
jgi:hypothetical protein